MVFEVRTMTESSEVIEIKPWQWRGKTTALATVRFPALGITIRGVLFLDTYRTMCLTPKPEFRPVLEDVRTFRLAA